MSGRAVLAGWLGLLLSACATNGLHSLVAEGPELHASLVTRTLDGLSHRELSGGVMPENPYLSNDPAFVETVASYASQGRLDATGVRSALYDLYVGERELGIYGLEAASTADADRLEQDLREIWAVNVRIERARVHRSGNVLAVVWHDGVSRECWEAVNTGVGERLGTR